MCDVEQMLNVVFKRNGGGWNLVIIEINRCTKVCKSVIKVPLLPLKHTLLPHQSSRRQTTPISAFMVPSSSSA